MTLCSCTDTSHTTTYLTSPHLSPLPLTCCQLTPTPDLTSPHLPVTSTPGDLTSPYLLSPLSLTSPAVNFSYISPHHLTSPHLTSHPSQLTPTSGDLISPHLLLTPTPHLTSPHLTYLLLTPTPGDLTSPYVLLTPTLTSLPCRPYISPHLTSPSTYLTQLTSHLTPAQ